MGLIERKKLHKVNRKEYSKGLRIVSKFSSQDEKSIFVQHFWWYFRKLSVRPKYDPGFFFDVKSRRLGTSVMLVDSWFYQRLSNTYDLFKTWVLFLKLFITIEFSFLLFDGFFFFSHVWSTWSKYTRTFIDAYVSFLIRLSNRFFFFFLLSLILS